MGKAASTDEPGPQVRQTALRWLRFWSAPPNDDAYVAQWKRAWTAGAQARWNGAPQGGNPHRSGSPMHKAWIAGWGWADKQPDRRIPSTVRFATPQRRAADRTSTLRRSAQAGAVGLSALAVAGWLWRGRRRTK